MTKPLLVFDMDGVLVDVTDSYFETIVRTVEHFTQTAISREQIQDYKIRGGLNDDWELSYHAIRAAGVDVPFARVVAHFQSLFLGNENDGLILRERWIARPGTLELLSKSLRFAIFTGRPKDEACLTLRRFAAEFVFEPIVGMHDVDNKKPAPDGLIRIARWNPDSTIYYVGDTVDDARSARAAGVAFIGIAAPANPRYIDLVFSFQQESALAIVDDINYLNEVFAS